MTERNPFPSVGPVVRRSSFLLFLGALSFAQAPAGPSSGGADEGGHGGSDPDSLPVTLGPEYHDITGQEAARSSRPHSPRVRKRLVGRVREVLSTVPSGSSEDELWGIAIVAKASDKPRIQEYLEERHPRLARLKDDLDGVDAAVYLYEPSRPVSESHQAPAARLSEPRPGSDRRDLLSELWQRRIIGADVNQPSPDDMRLLERVRRAEAAGAIDELKARRSAQDGLAVETRLPGDAIRRLVLTREGYDRWLFVRSQDAIAFFERKGVDAKWVFKLRDKEGRPLFGAGGLLTEDGDKVYRRASLGMAMFWVLPSGEIMGTRPAPARPRPAPAPPSPRVAPRGAASAAGAGQPAVPATGPGAAVPAPASSSGAAMPQPGASAPGQTVPEPPDD